MVRGGGSYSSVVNFSVLEEVYGIVFFALNKISRVLWPTWVDLWTITVLSCTCFTYNEWYSATLTNYSPQLCISNNPYDCGNPVLALSSSLNGQQLYILLYTMLPHLFKNTAKRKIK